MPIRACFIVAACLCATVQAEELPENDNWATFLVDGLKLTQNDVRSLERKLDENPREIGIRTKLLSYYRWHEPRDKFVTHMTWMIEYQPRSWLFRSQIIELGPEELGYKAISAAWDGAVEKHKEKADTLGAAGLFFSYVDSLKAITLFKAAELLAPNNPEWLEAHAEVHRFLRVSKKVTPADNAEHELKLLEIACDLEKDEAKRLERRFNNLSKMTEAALECKTEKAGKYATELISLASKFPKCDNYGYAIYCGNETLGQLALKEGNVDKAKEYLLLAGNTDGFLQFGKAGPPFNLAKELLAKGETKTVLRFFKLAGSFWQLGGEKLKKWRSEIEAGKNPNFDE